MRKSLAEKVHKCHLDQLDKYRPIIDAPAAAARDLECVAMQKASAGTVGRVANVWPAPSASGLSMMDSTVKSTVAGRKGYGYRVAMTTPRDRRYAGYRFPAEVIATVVWLCFRFPLGLRMVEEMLAARGLTVSHKTVRQWVLKFGRDIADRLRRRAPRRGDKWHIDELVLTITGKKHYLRRAVDRDGFVLDVLVQNRRDTKAAKRLLRKLLKKQGWAPRVKVTDKLKSYAAAKRDIMPGVEHRQHKGINNRAENSRQPTPDASGI